MNNIKNIENPFQIFSKHYTIDKMSVVKIGKLYNVAPTTVSKILRDNGLNIFKNSNSGRKRIYNVNHNYFNVIDTEVKAYILGFIYADGYITDKNKLGITLHLKDEEILLKIKMLMGSEYPLHYWDSAYDEKHKETPRVRFLVNSLQLYNDLKNLGCSENKSDILKFPNISQVPISFISHFIRGYFDGDGSVYKSFIKKDNKIYEKPCFSFISTKEFLEDLISHLPFIYKGKLYKEKRTSKNVWEFKTSGIERTNLFYNWLYNDSTIYLDRKKKKFEELLKIDVQRL